MIYNSLHIKKRISYFFINNLDYTLFFIKICTVISNLFKISELVMLNLGKYLYLNNTQK